MDAFDAADFEAADFVVEDVEVVIGLPGRGSSSVTARSFTSSSVTVRTRGESSIS